jgi:hypothetical protein
VSSPREGPALSGRAAGRRREPEQRKGRARMVSTAAGGRLGASDARDGSGTGAAERRRAPPARRAASVLTSTGPSCSTGGATETYGTGKGRARTVSTAAGVRIGASDAWQCNGYALACRKPQAPPIAAGASRGTRDIQTKKAGRSKKKCRTPAAPTRASRGTRATCIFVRLMGAARDLRRAHAAVRAPGVPLSLRRQPALRRVPAHPFPRPLKRPVHFQPPSPRRRQKLRKFGPTIRLD